MRHSSKHDKHRLAGAEAADLHAEISALNALVDDFACAMKKKLVSKAKAADGAIGWDSEEWTEEQIYSALIEHIPGSDVSCNPVDVANFCAFLWNRRNAES